MVKPYFGFDLWRADLGTATWTNTGAMSASRERYAAVLLANGKVLAAAGDDLTNYLASAEIYNPSIGTWTSEGSLNTARDHHVITRLANGNVLAARGQNAGGVLSVSEIFISSNTTVTAFSLLNPTKLSDGQFQFAFTNTPDMGFIACAATNLSIPSSNWTLLSGPVEISPGQYQLTDAQATNNSRRFYRIRSP